MIVGVTRHMLPHLLWGPPPPCKQAVWKNNKYAKRNVPKSVQIVVSLIKPIAFLPFSLLSPSSLLKLPIVVIQKFCYHGNVTSHFSSLFEVAWHLTIKLFVNDLWNKSYMNFGNEMKMKKWSSQWTQFRQLRKEARKIFRTSTGLVKCGFKPRWSPEFFFQASLRNCINYVHCDDHFFIFNKTVSRQKLWVGNIAKSMAPEGRGAMLSANVDVYFHEMSNVEMCWSLLLK